MFPWKGFYKTKTLKKTITRNKSIFSVKISNRKFSIFIYGWMCETTSQRLSSNQTLFVPDEHTAHLHTITLFSDVLIGRKGRFVWMWVSCECSHRQIRAVKMCFQIQQVWADVHLEKQQRLNYCWKGSGIF